MISNSQGRGSIRSLWLELLGILCWDAEAGNGTGVTKVHAYSPLCVSCGWGGFLRTRLNQASETTSTIPQSADPFQRRDEACRTSNRAVYIYQFAELPAISFARYRLFVQCFNVSTIIFCLTSTTDMFLHLSTVDEGLPEVPFHGLASRLLTLVKGGFCWLHSIGRRHGGRRECNGFAPAKRLILPQPFSRQHTPSVISLICTKEESLARRD